MLAQFTLLDQELPFRVRIVEHRPQRVFYLSLKSVARSDFPGEQRDTEAAITLWQQKTCDGRIPGLNEFDFHRLQTDWGYRFLVSTDEIVSAAVFITYMACRLRACSSYRTKPRVTCR